MKTFCIQNISRFLVLLTASMMSFLASAAQTESNFTTYSRYDSVGRLVGTIESDPDGTHALRYPAQRNTYDPATGLLSRTESGELANWSDENTLPSTWTGFTIYSAQAFYYDSLGRKTAVISLGKNDQVLTITEYKYDDYSRIRCVAQRMSLGTGFDACVPTTAGIYGADRITRYTYDDAANGFARKGNVVAEERGVGTSLVQTYVTNTYNGTLLTSQTDANGNKTDFVYEPATSRLQKIIYPSSTTGAAASNAADYVQYGYDLNGNKNYERKRNGAVINYTLDNNNRPIVKDYVDNTKQKDIYYDYDLRGLQIWQSFTSAASNADRTSQKYDGFGNLQSELVSIGGVGRSIWSSYDLDNNRIKVLHPDGVYFTYQFEGDRLGVIYEGGGTRMLQFDYNPDGHRKWIYRRSGISTTGYTYTDGVRLDGFSQDFPGTANDLNNTFQYNPANQITQLSASNTQYFNAEDTNRTGSYVPNGLNQYSAIAGQPLGYDSNGNLTNDGTVTYQYDDENRLISTGGAVTSVFVYDPRGRLFQSTISGVKTQFLYDGDALLAEFDGTTGTMLRRYVHGDRVDEPLIQYNGSATGISTWRYLHTDQQGSIIAQSDATGAVLSTNGYDSYGIPAGRNVDRFGYTGQIWFKELGLFHYKARMYHPKLGRFLQTDPIGYKDQMNLYAYVGNDPLNKTDPTGLCPDACILEGTAAVGTAVVYTGALIGAATVCEIACGKVATAIENFVTGLFTESASTDNGEVVTDRPEGSDGKKGSTGGPGEGKRFKPESPEVKEAKEGVPCRYCDTPTTNKPGQPNSRERDHIDPKSRRGNNSSNNEGDSCRTCNRGKGAKTPEEFVPKEPKVPR